MSLQGLPSATSLMVKSNSLRATKSTARPAIRLFSGSTATLAPMKPILMSGLIALIISAVFTSDLNDGVEVCITTRSRFLNLRNDVLEAQVVRRRIDQLRALDQRGRLREPRRIPEGAHLALHLIAGAGAAVDIRRMRADAEIVFFMALSLTDSATRSSGTIRSHLEMVISPVHAASDETPGPKSSS